MVKRHSRLLELGSQWAIETVHLHASNLLWSRGLEPSLVYDCRFQGPPPEDSTVHKVENWHPVGINPYTVEYFYFSAVKNYKVEPRIYILSIRLLFANIWCISMKRACMRRPWSFIRMSEFFSRMKIASVDGKQHFSEIVLSALGFSL